MMIAPMIIPAIKTKAVIGARVKTLLAVVFTFDAAVTPAAGNPFIDPAILYFATYFRQALSEFIIDHKADNTDDQYTDYCANILGEPIFIFE
jgi:hypothetical protein